MEFFFIFIIRLFDLLTLAIILRVILFWFLPRPTNRLIIVLIQITEPFLRPLRRIIPRVGLLDFTPLVAIIIFQMISRLLDYLVS